MSSIGLPEIAIVLVIVLVIFGPKRLPQLGRSLGSGMREFKDAVTGKHKDEDLDEIEAPPPIPADRVTTASTDDPSVTTASTDDSSSSPAKAADAS
jgi:sec-independent protein translocase protein TatA